MATEYLERRRLRDQTALQNKLSLQLEKDIQLLHAKNEFYDLLLHWDVENITLKVHQCILKTRTPALLTELLNLSSQPGNLCIDLSNYKPDKITTLIEKIYSNSKVRTLESQVVVHLQDKVTEKFYTPACTPIDCVTQTLYYSLVTVDSREYTSSPPSKHNNYSSSPANNNNYCSSPSNNTPGSNKTNLNSINEFNKELDRFHQQHRLNLNSTPHELFDNVDKELEEQDLLSRSYTNTNHVDRDELEEQDLLSRSFELIRKKRKKSTTAAAASVTTTHEKRRTTTSFGHVRKVKPVVVVVSKMSKTSEDSSGAKSRGPVYTSSNTDSVYTSSNTGSVYKSREISSREHTTSDTSGVDVNESSTSSLTEPEIWDSTEHEDNDEDFFDEKTLHGNDGTPLRFTPDTLKSGPASHYFPPTSSVLPTEPTSLTSNASSNFFIDASSLLDENECLLSSRDVNKIHEEPKRDVKNPNKFSEEPTQDVTKDPEEPIRDMRHDVGDVSAIDVQDKTPNRFSEEPMKDVNHFSGEAVTDVKIANKFSEESIRGVKQILEKPIRDTDVSHDVGVTVQDPTAHGSHYFPPASLFDGRDEPASLGIYETQLENQHGSGKDSDKSVENYGKGLNNPHRNLAEDKPLTNKHVTECHSTKDVLENVPEKDTQPQPDSKVKAMSVSTASLDQPFAAKRTMIANVNNQTVEKDRAFQSNNGEFSGDQSYETFTVNVETKCEDLAMENIRPGSKSVGDITSKHIYSLESQHQNAVQDSCKPSSNSTQIRRTSSSPPQSFVHDNDPVLNKDDDHFSTKEMTKLNSTTNSVTNVPNVYIITTSSVNMNNVVRNSNDLCKNDDHSASDDSKQELVECKTRPDTSPSNNPNQSASRELNVSNVSSNASHLIPDVTNDAFQTFVINESLHISSSFQDISSHLSPEHQHQVEPKTFIIDSTNTHNNRTFDLVSEIVKSDSRDTSDSLNDSFSRQNEAIGNEISKRQTSSGELRGMIDDDTTHKVRTASKETLDLISETDAVGDPFETGHIESSYEKRGLVSNLSFDLIQTTQPSRDSITSRTRDSTNMRNSENETNRNHLDKENSRTETWENRIERTQSPQNDFDKGNSRIDYRNDLDKVNRGNETSRTSAEQAQTTTANPYTYQLEQEANPSLSRSSELKLVKESFNEQLHHSMTSSTNQNPVPETRPKPATSPRTILTNEINKPVPETRTRTNHNREDYTSQCPVAAMRTSMTNSMTSLTTSTADPSDSNNSHGIRTSMNNSTGIESSSLDSTRVISTNPDVTTSGSNIVPNYTTNDSVPMSNIVTNFANPNSNFTSSNNYTNSGVNTMMSNSSVPHSNSVVSTNPFLNPFIDYSEQNSMISADSIEVQRAVMGQQQFYPQATPLTGNGIHGTVGYHAQVNSNMATGNTANYHTHVNVNSTMAGSHYIPRNDTLQNTSINYQGHENGTQNMPANYHTEGNGKQTMSPNYYTQENHTQADVYSQSVSGSTQTEGHGNISSTYSTQYPQTINPIPSSHYNGGNDTQNMSTTHHSHNMGTINTHSANNMSPNTVTHYTQPINVISSSHIIHGTQEASATKISRSFSSNPNVNQINTSFSSTNPFLTDMQNETMSSSNANEIQNATMVLSNSNDISNATMVLSNTNDIPNATMVLSNSNDIPNATMVLSSHGAANPAENTFIISDYNGIYGRGSSITGQYGQEAVNAIHAQSSIHKLESGISETHGHYGPSHYQIESTFPGQYAHTEAHQPVDVLNQTHVIDNRSDDHSVGSRPLEAHLNGMVAQYGIDSQVVYRRDKVSQVSQELYIQHSTPLSASVDNLLDMNYTPIKPEETNNFDLNVTQIKRLSCKLNDENLSKANEQLNALLAADTSAPNENYSAFLVNETNSKTLVSKHQAPLENARPVDLNISRQRACEDFHSPDSLNGDDEIKHAHAHIDEDNRSKTSSDIDAVQIVSEGVASAPRQASTSWTVEFPIGRSRNQSGDTSRHSPRGDHFVDGTLSKSSTSLVKHGDSFSHNSKSCGFYIDLNEPCGMEEEEKTRNKPEKKMFNMFIDISNSDSSDKERSTKSPRPLLRKKLKPLSVTDRFLQRQCSAEDKTGTIGSGEEESEGEHPEVTRGRTLFRNTNTPPPSTQASTTDQSMSDLTESGLRKHNSTPGGGGSSTSNSGSGFFMFIGTGGADSNPTLVKRRLSSGCHGNQAAPARTHPNRHSWNSDSSGGGGGGVSGVASAAGGGVNKHRRASSISCRLSDLDTSPSAPTDPSAKLTSSWHASSKKLTDSSDSSVLADTKSDQTSSSMKSDATYNIETGIAANEKSPGTESVKAEIKEGRELVGKDACAVGFKSIPEDSALDSSEPNETYVIERDGKSKKGAEQLVLDTPTMMEEDGYKYAGDHALPAGHSAAPAGGSESFVKLSDMDCPSSSTGHRVLAPPTRLTRSTQESRLGQGSLNLVQGSRSLTRLFPHLVVPPGGQQASLSSSQEDGHTTISTVSSLQSSNNRSTLDVSTDEADPVPAISSLGADLLRMFLDEISADVTVEVAGRRIRAHKCVLSSRCQYFAAVLSGGWVESAGNVISLQGYSYSSVHFALAHIYSGAGDIPDNINIVELATLADMLCLEGLKEVISGVLKHKYCHYFHKPCNTCILGVIEVLPLAAAYGLDDIYRKSLRWIAKHFTRVWPTKPFAAMPKELIDKCFKQILVHMTSDNVLDTLQSISKVYALLPSDTKWTEPVHCALNKLNESCAKYIAQHLSTVLTSTTLLALSRDQMWDIGSVESVLLTAGSTLSPDEACRACVQLDVMNNQTPHPTWHESFGRLLIDLQSTVKACLVRQASKCCRSPAWSLMPPSLRLDIQETAGLIRVPGDEKRRARMMRKSESTSTSAGGKLRSMDLAQVRQSIAQSQHQPRKPPVPDLIPKAKPKFSEIKSRYLDSRPSRFSDPPPLCKSGSTSSSSSVTHTRPSGVSSNYNRASAILSSSESSRQSSPAMAKRNIMAQPQQKDKSTSRLSLDSKLDTTQNKKQDMRLIRDKLTLNIRKSHETDEDVKTMGVAKKPAVAMATRLPLRSNENRSVLSKSQSTTEKKTPAETKLTRTSRLSLDSGRSPFSESTRSSPKPSSVGGGGRSRLSLESKSLRSSPLDNRTRESLRASTDRLSLDTLSTRNKRRTGSSSSNTSCSSTKATSLSTVTTPNMNKKPVNINRSPIKMNKTALLRSSAGQQRNTPHTPPPVTRAKTTRDNSVSSNVKTVLHSNGKHLHGENAPPVRNYGNQENGVPSNQEEEGKKLGTRSGTFCLDESASILKNIGTPVS
uniref:BTB/POZ domain-containing protein 8 n=1 Tax=Cacopsylla melanoneura TaxID=428564 RepID=A0A8D8YPA1_9HEMI